MLSHFPFLLAMTGKLLASPWAVNRAGNRNGPRYPYAPRLKYINKSSLFFGNRNACPLVIKIN
jgi:hypothetical protein